MTHQTVNDCSQWEQTIALALSKMSADQAKAFLARAYPELMARVERTTTEAVRDAVNAEKPDWAKVFAGMGAQGLTPLVRALAKGPRPLRQELLAGMAGRQ